MSIGDSCGSQVGDGESRDGIEQPDVSAAAVLDVLVTTANEDEIISEENVAAQSRDSTDNLSQNWITSKNDKRLLHDHGHRWKQGQWTSEENEMLRNNISSYCQVSQCRLVLHLVPVVVLGCLSVIHEC